MRHTGCPALGVLGGLAAFTCVLGAAPLASIIPFGFGTMLIGFGSALFVVGTLSAVMGQATGGFSGLALGTWGAVQACAAGAAIATGGVLRDAVSALAQRGCSVRRWLPRSPATPWSTASRSSCCWRPRRDQAAVRGRRIASPGGDSQTETSLPAGRDHPAPEGVLSAVSTSA